MKTAEEKIELIKYWSKWFMEHTEGWYSDVAGELGAELAYLFTAIANDSGCLFNGEEDLIVLLEDAEVPDDASIWDYIEIEDDSEIIKDE